MKNTPLPHSIDAEKYVLGAMITDSIAITIAVGIVSRDSFYSHKHQIIFQAVVNVFNAGVTVDFITVSEEIKSLDKKNIVGIDYLTELVMNVPTTATISANARIVQEYFIKRKLIQDSQKIIQEAFSPENDAIDLLDQQQNFLDDLQNFNVNSIITPEKQPEILTTNFEFYSSASNLFPRTGIAVYDRNFGAFLPGQNIVIAARPSVGKTAFAQSLAKNISAQGVPVAFISLEMSAYELLLRWNAMSAQMNSEWFVDPSKKSITQIAVRKFAEILRNGKIYIDDTAQMNEVTLFAKLKRMVQLYNIKVAFVDYIGLMDCSVKKSNRAEEISHISRKIKMIAKKLNISIFTLVQINREAEKNKYPTPALHNLRDSGSIEQDADTVILLDRPEFYGFDFFEDKEPCTGKARLIIAKRRGGKTGVATVGFRRDTTEFYDLNPNYEPPREYEYVPEGYEVDYLTDDDVGF